MTREEEIINEAKKYYSDNIQCYDAFLHGTKFADKHPKNVWPPCACRSKWKGRRNCRQYL